MLEVSLKKSGFNVTTAVSGKDALDKVQTAQPNLIISDTEMAEMDGFVFCETLKSNPDWEHIPFIFLTGQTSIENKIRGLELGVADYLTKPIYIKEITTRVGILLQKTERARLEAERDSRTRFSGLLSDMGVVDLIQTIEISRKSGLIHFTGENQERAAIYFRTGKVIDAEAGQLAGEDAVYRLLTWGDGGFEVAFRNVRRKDVIEMSSQGLLMEGMRRLDEWGRHLEQLPSLESLFEVDVVELAERLPELPDSLNAILKLFDGQRSLMAIIDASEFGDLECLEVISKLYFEGLIVEVSDEVMPETLGEGGTDLSGEGWLSDASAPLLPVEEEEEITSAELEATEVDLSLRPSLVEAAIGGLAPVPSEAEIDQADLLARAAADDLIVDVDQALDVGDGIAPDEDVIGGPARSGEVDLPVDEIIGEGGASGRSTIPGFAAATPPVERTPVAVIDYADEFDSEPTPLPTPDPGEFGEESSSPGTISSAGAEVASASGEVVYDFDEELTDPARQIVTIRPRETQPLAQVVPRGSPLARGKRADSVNDEASLDAEPGGDAVPDLDVDELEDDARDQEELEDDGADDAVEDEDEEYDDDDDEEYDEDDEYDDDEYDDDAVEDEDGAKEEEDGDAGEEEHVADAAAGQATTATAGDDRAAEYDPRYEEVHGARDSSGRQDEGDEEGQGGPRYGFTLIAGVAIVAAVIIFLATRGGDKQSHQDARLASSVSDAMAMVVVAADAGLAPDDAVAASSADAAVAPPPIDAAAPEVVQSSYKALIKEARRMHRRRRYGEALALVDQAIAERRASRAYQLKADILMGKGDTKLALVAADRAVKIAPRSAKAWLTKGMLHYELKHYPKAKKALERYLTLKPNAGNADTIRMLLEEL